MDMNDAAYEVEQFNPYSVQIECIAAYGKHNNDRFIVLVDRPRIVIRNHTRPFFFYLGYVQTFKMIRGSQVEIFLIWFLIIERTI